MANKHIKNTKNRPSAKFWDAFGRGLNDNLNWNVCENVIREVNSCLSEKNEKYFSCLKMINKYKTKDNYFDRNKTTRKRYSIFKKS